MVSPRGDPSVVRVESTHIASDATSTAPADGGEGVWMRREWGVESRPPLPPPEPAAGHQPVSSSSPPVLVESESAAFGVVKSSSDRFRFSMFSDSTSYTDGISVRLR